MLLDLILSTIAFFVAVHYLRRYLDDMEVRKGMTRSILIFVLASVASTVVSSVVEKLQGNSANPVQNAMGVGKLLQ
ncbi:MAG: hypothetical protein ACYCZR_11935 [Burkholderiales bacterium]